MVKVHPHFKVHTALPNNPKMAGLYQDKRLFGVWVSIGVEAIASFAPKNNDTLCVNSGKLTSLTGHKRRDKQLLTLRQLAQISPLTFKEKEHYVIIRIPNLAEKHGMVGLINSNDDPLEDDKFPNSNSNSNKNSNNNSSDKSSDPSGSDPSDDPPKKPKPAPNDFDFEMSDLLAQLLREHVPAVKIPTMSQRTSWAKCCRKMRETDKCTEDQIRYAITWLYSEGNQGEYAFVVQSMDSLRKKWDGIVIAIQNAKPSQKSPPPVEITKAERQDRIRMIGADIINTLDLVEGNGLDTGQRKIKINLLNEYKTEFLAVGGEISPDTHRRLQAIFGMT